VQSPFHADLMCAPWCRFHEIEPQSSVMELLRPSQLSRKVLAPPRGTVPASELASNTLVLSGGQSSVRCQDASAQAWGEVP